MSATIRACNGDCFVQVSEEALDTDSFVVSARSGVKTYTEECANLSEDTTKGAAGVDNNETTHADFQKNAVE